MANLPVHSNMKINATTSENYMGGLKTSRYVDIFCQKPRYFQVFFQVNQKLDKEGLVDISIFSLRNCKCRMSHSCFLFFCSQSYAGTTNLEQGTVQEHCQPSYQ